MNNSTISSNSTLFHSAKCEEIGAKSVPFKIAFIILYSLIGAIAIFGNSSLVYIIYKTPRMKSSFNYFTANMAVSDIIVQFCSIPRLVTDLVFDRVRTWLIADTMGVVLCKLLFFVQDICTAVSIECIVLIAIDRFLAVVAPTTMRLASHGRLRVVIIAMTWVIAMLLHAPYLHFQTVVTNQDGSMSCTIDWSPFPQHYHTKYMAVLVTILIFIPLGSITILYGIIFTIVKRRKIPGHVSSDKRQFRHYEKVKSNVLQLSIAIVSVFIISWAPNVVFWALLMTVWGWRVPCNMYPFRFFALLMGMSNTATNPWIYFILSANYRQAIQKLLSCTTLYQHRYSSRRSKTWTTKQTNSGAEADIGGQLQVGHQLMSTSL